MKERPILFSGPMVRAILDGRKTKTRRVMALQPDTPPTLYFGENAKLRAGESFKVGALAVWGGESEFDYYDCHCPYGGIRGRLWVRETFAETDSDGGPVVAYQAGGYRIHGATGNKNAGTWKDETFEGEAGEVYPPDKWKPSIFMPRWASRITLEITGIRVERVQDITEEDAKSEGVDPIRVGYWRDGRAAGRKDIGGSDSYIEGFGMLWDSINGNRPGCSWADNPWVWVVAFRRVHQ